MGTKRRYIPPADWLARLWYQPESWNPRHPLVPVEGPDLLALERHIRRLAADRPRKLATIVASDQVGAWQLDLDLWHPQPRPAVVCTCPGGRPVHAIRERLGMSPYPVADHSASPACPFCGADGAFFAPYKLFDYPYAHTLSNRLTVLLVPPPDEKPRWLSYEADRHLAAAGAYAVEGAGDVALAALESGQTTLPLSEREAVLVGLRRAHYAAHEQLFAGRAEPDPLLTARAQDAAFHFLIPFWTNLCYWPERNNAQLQACSRPVYTKPIRQGRLVTSGSVAVAAPLVALWEPHLAPLGYQLCI